MHKAKACTVTSPHVGVTWRLSLFVIQWQHNQSDDHHSRILSFIFWQCSSFLSTQANNYTKNWRLSVHLQLKSTGTIDCQFFYWLRSAAAQRSWFHNHGGGGGAISMVSKNWEMFFAGLSGFFSSKQLKFPPDHEKFPSKIIWKERMGRTPYFRTRMLPVVIVMALDVTSLAHCCFLLFPPLSPPFVCSMIVKEHRAYTWHVELKLNGF